MTDKERRTKVRAIALMSLNKMKCWMGHAGGIAEGLSDKELLSLNKDVLEVYKKLAHVVLSDEIV